MASDGTNYGLEVTRGVTEDMADVFSDAASRACAAEGAYIRCLLDRVRQGELGVYALSARCRTAGAICYKELDGDAELVFGHVAGGGPEAYFLEAVARDLFAGGVHTVRSNFNWPEPDAFILAARAMGFAVTERMGMALSTRPMEPSYGGFELLPWQDAHAGEVCRIMYEGQALADRPVYPMFSRPEGVRALLSSVMRDAHGQFMRELSYLAFADGRLIGFLISTRLSDGSILILDIGVDQGYRRRGVGGAMLDRLTGDSYKKGHGLIVLAVTSTNYEAIRLYERKGFKTNGHFRQHVLSKVR